MNSNQQFLALFVKLHFLLNLAFSTHAAVNMQKKDVTSLVYITLQLLGLYIARNLPIEKQLK